MPSKAPLTVAGVWCDAGRYELALPRNGQVERTRLYLTPRGLAQLRERLGPPGQTLVAIPRTMARAFFLAASLNDDGHVYAWLTPAQIERAARASTAPALGMAACIAAYARRVRLAAVNAAAADAPAPAAEPVPSAHARGARRRGERAALAAVRTSRTPAMAAKRLAAIERRLRRAGMTAAGTRRVLATCRPAAALVPLIGVSAPRGASRLGGLPDLPASSPWPRHLGAPLAFLAQVRVAALPASVRRDLGLPRDGLLSMFGAPAAAVGRRPRTHLHVALHQDVRAVTPRQAPADLHTTFPAAAVAILEVTTVPDPDGWLIRDVALGRADLAAYEEACAYIAEPVAQLGGHVIGQQGAMEAQCVRATAPAGARLTAGHVRMMARRWRPLFALASIPSLDMTWDDDGTYYVWIPARDLARGAFGRAASIVQGG